MSATSPSARAAQISSSAAAAEAMDGIYRHQRFIYDVTRAAYLLGRDRLIAGLGVAASGAVLEIGCGTGRNLIHIARRYPSARCYGVDISTAMLATARRAIVRRGLAPRIICAPADATSFDAAQVFGRATFDRVVVSYALSMIPQWREVVSNAARHVTPGGSLHIVDFGDFAGYPAALRASQLAWLARFSVTPIPALEAELGRIAHEIGWLVTSERLYRGYAIRAVLTRPLSD